MRTLIHAGVLAAAVFAFGCGERAEQSAQPAAVASLEETGLQGQVSKADQDSGRSQQPYMWNMRLVGQQDIQNRGENGNLGWIGDCAYVSVQQPVQRFHDRRARRQPAAEAVGFGKLKAG
ncbi:MAG: hypothetical protein IT176_07015 [Acidobacteria bacterium]|nr:hypothetical protein [Acidobacteriota bacterium]